MTLQQYILQHYSPRSVNRYSQQINRFINYSGSQAQHANYQHVVDYIGHLRDQTLHPKTIKNHLFAIKLYYRYLLAIGARNDHPCASLHLKDQIDRSIDIDGLYNRQRLEKIYNDFEGPSRDKVILSLLIFQALTVHEIIHIQIHDVDLLTGTLQVRPTQSKGRNGNKGRVLTLHPGQILLLNTYINHDRKSLEPRQKPGLQTHYLILSDSAKQLYGSYINRMLRKHGIYYSPLKMRQTVIAELLKQGKDLRIVQEFAGHRKAGSTEAYLQTGLEELRISISKLHPLQ